VSQHRQYVSFHKHVFGFAELLKLGVFGHGYISCSLREAGTGIMLDGGQLENILIVIHDLLAAATLTVFTLLFLLLPS